MFGLYQRDEHTIPSEFARLAQARRHPVRVVNYGRLAYVNWQESQLLEQLVGGSQAPDLAVFYDGFNEVVGQFQLGLPHRADPHRGRGDRRAPWDPQRANVRRAVERCPALRVAPGAT